MVRSQCLQMVLIIFYLLFVPKHQLCFSESAGFSLELIPRDFPVSPLHPGNLTVSERIQSWARVSYARANFQPATLDLNPIRFSMLRDSFLYIVRVVIGNRPVYLAFDTGSGLIWTQCEPCVNCYNLTYPIYDSRVSNTYGKLPCSHTICRTDNYTYQCVNRECSYNYRYTSGSHTKGVLSLEKFTFPAAGNTSRIVYNIVFGCSNDNANFLFQRNGKIAGIMGLSLAPTSLVAQLHTLINRRFSYCLVPFTHHMTIPSIVRFGGDIIRPRVNLQTTPFVHPNVSKTFLYYLNLIDISVGQQRLRLPSNTFTIKRNGAGGCLIDSGTVLTWIDQNANGINAYARVIRAFQNYFSHFNLTKLEGRDNLELCYEYKSYFHQYASMTFHFAGANFVVDPQHVYLFNTAEKYFCIALLPGTGRTNLGAYHQQNMRLIYDVNIGALQFVSAECAQDQQ